ncbi:ABC transporter permease [Rhizorhabdus dicambivorans]|uniref:ABC transporter permease n=1 Tax=Rhizorhabdus dicambivorans TaxID=1850238 RepID=A0A2A4FR33_9SPHN|nr:ABC transporter permease [Rhizorhabdus dicambivorans]ATE65142.1 ABC transporter permease [Rhizorhabdus dicambivorans]PCE39908.1 ABC transporter permease [Rhizorhabdus dicambivorans]
MSSSFDPRRFRALLVKESLQIVRDPSTLLIAFLLPLILLFLFGFGVSLDTARSRIGLAVQDSSEPALSLANAYQSSRWFDVATRRNIRELESDLVAGRLRGIVVIPEDFGRRLAAGRGAEVQVITDGSLPNTASFVAAYAEGVLASWAETRALERGKAARPAMSLIVRHWFNPGLQSRFALIPGSITIVMTMIGTLLTALVVAREWERGTLEALMATPIGMAEFLASKIIPYFVLGLGSMLLCTLLAVYLFGVPFRGSVLGLLAISSAFLIPALGQGLLISAATKNQFVASQVALLTAFLPGMLLSGFLFEIASMPRPIQLATYLVPARYLVPSLTTVFVVGDLWELFLRNILTLLAFGVLFFSLAFRATRRRIA